MGPCGGRIRRVLGRLEHLAAAEAGSFSPEASAWGKLEGAPVGAGRQSLVRLPFDVAHVSSIRRSWAVTCSPWERASGHLTTLSLEHSAKDAMNFSLQTRDLRIVARSIGGAPSLLAPFIRTRADRLLRLPAQPLSAYSTPGLRR